MAENLLSKVKIGDVTYNLKDSTARSNIATLLGDNTLAALGTAAWRAVAASISDGDGKIADAATVKAYVDAQIGSVKQFDVIVCAAVAAEIPEGAIYKDGATVITGTMAASANTMYKLYMVKKSDAGAGAYLEYISIRKGAGTEADPYTYSWEMIGSTVVDLSNYVQKTRKICNITLENDITVDQIKEALGLKELAYKNKNEVKAVYNGTTITGVTASGSLTCELSGDLAYTSATADLTRAAYTPAGNVNVTAADDGSVVTGGSINVTVKDAAAATAVTDITYDSYTPAGEISKPNVNLTSAEKTFATGLKGGKVASFTEGAFTANVPTAIDTTKFNGGSFTGASAASFTQGSKASFTQGAKASLSTSNISYIEEGVKVAIDSSDEEMLVFTNVTAKSAKAVDTFTANGDDQFTANGDDSFTANNVGTFTAASLADGFYTAGSAASKAADTFVANELQSVNTDTVNNVTGAALAANPEFTGTAADIKFKGAKYLKQEIDTKTFTPNKANLSFAGTEVANFQVTGVNYDKANKGDLAASGTASGLTVSDIVVPSADLDITDND